MTHNPTTSVETKPEELTIEELMEEYRSGLQKSQNESEHGTCHGGVFAEDFIAKKGRRFWKILQHNRRNGSNGSVHSFVEIATGFVFKAASWKAPAQGIRFNLMDPESRQRCMEAVSRSGGHAGFLYRH